MAKPVKPEPERPHVLIDQREQAPLCFTDSFSTERVLLPVGDYSLAGATDSVAIERKRNGELQSCCGTDRARFIEQIERMRAFPVRWIVVEATMDDVVLGLNRSSINPLSVLGTIIKFGSDWQIPTMFCGDHRNAELFVERILMREFRRLQAAKKGNLA